MLILMGALVLIISFGYLKWSELVEKEKAAAIAQQEEEKIAASEKLKQEEIVKQELLGVNLQIVIENIIPDENEIFTPAPLTIIKSFAPCKLHGSEGDWQGSCKLNVKEKLLVDENVGNKRTVDIKTSGPRSMVDYILLSSQYPNTINYAFDEIKEWGIKEIDCGQDKSIDHSIIYIAKPKGKREFVFETTLDGGSGGYWGTLKVHLEPIPKNNACSLVELNAAVPIELQNNENKNFPSDIAQNNQHTSMSQMSLQEVAKQIGPERLVQCLFESVVVSVQSVQDRDEGAKNRDIVSTAASKVYSKLAEAFESQQQLKIYADSYTSKTGKISYESENDIVISCAQEPLIEPMISKIIHK